MGRRPGANGAGRHRALGLDAFDLLSLVALFVLAAGPLAWLAWRASAHDLVWPGIDAGTVADQWQYVAWARGAGEQLLISNRFQLEPTNAVFLHPGLVLSGALTWLGLGPALAYLLWKPVAVVALFVACRRYVHRLLSGTAERRAALVLALFFLTPVYILSGRVLGGRTGIWLGFSASTTWFGDILWGYSFAVLAVASVPAALLAYERDRAAGRIGPWAPLFALLSSWLHPWQGSILILIIVGSEAMLLVRSRRHRRPPEGAGLSGNSLPAARVMLATLGAACVPLVYYAVLSRVDPAWETAQSAVEFLDPPFWTVLAAIAPLALPALLAYRFPPEDFQAAALRIWPFAAVGLMVFIDQTGAGTFAAHALRGLTVPLAILAVIGLRSIPWGRPRPALSAAAAFAIALLIVPSTTLAVRKLFKRVNDHAHPYYLTTGERQALDYLDRNPREGSVYAPAYMGQAVPGETGRHTAVGHLTWTPNYGVASSFAARLFDGRLPAVARRLVVQRSGARFLLSGCKDGASLTKALDSMLVAVRRFGCATVYEIGSGEATRARPDQSRLVERNGAEEIALASGRLPVRAGPIAGAVDLVAIKSDQVSITGWAVGGARRPAEYIVVFAADGSVVAVEPTQKRTDIASAYGSSAKWAGFRLVVTDVDPRRLARPSGLRTFAVADGQATELKPSGPETFPTPRRGGTGP
jgi:hypothetical protein